MLLYFVGPKHPSGNCYISCFLTDRTAMNSLQNKTVEKFTNKVSTLGFMANDSHINLPKNIFKTFGYVSGSC